MFIEKPPPLFGYPATFPAHGRSWRHFCVFRRPLGWLAWKARPRLSQLLHKCEHCDRRFGIWDRPRLMGDIPVFHRECSVDPNDGGHRVPKAQAESMVERFGVKTEHNPR